MPLNLTEKSEMGGRDGKKFQVFVKALEMSRFFIEEFKNMELKNNSLLTITCALIKQVSIVGREEIIG